MKTIIKHTTCMQPIRPAVPKFCFIITTAKVRLKVTHKFFQILIGIILSRDSDYHITFVL